MKWFCLMIAVMVLVVPLTAWVTQDSDLSERIEKVEALVIQLQYNQHGLVELIDDPCWKLSNFACPVCPENLASVVHVVSSTGTLMYSPDHDPNTYTDNYECSQGHTWTTTSGPDELTKE